MKNEAITNEYDCIKEIRAFIKVSKENCHSDMKILDDIEKFEIPQERMDELLLIFEEFGIDMKIEDEDEMKKEKCSDEETFGSINSLQLYLKDIGATSLLSHDEEIALAKRILEGDNYAKEKMIKHNLKLVVSIARRYHTSTMTIDDLIQEGSIGLMKAIEKYDYTKGFKFSTYATWWIRQAVTRAISDQSRTIRLPVHMMETINKMTRTKSRLSNELNREPELEEIAEEMGLSMKKIREIMDYGLDPVSLETPIGDEGESSLSDFVEDEKFVSAQVLLEQEDLRNRIIEMLDTLSARESNVLKMRFGIGYNKTYTLEEIGTQYNITRERIRQIEARAIRRLQENGRKSIIYGYTDDYMAENPY